MNDEMLKYLKILGKSMKSAFDLTKSVPSFAYSIVKDVASIDINFGAKENEFPSATDEMILSKIRIMVISYFIIHNTNFIFLLYLFT